MKKKENKHSETVNFAHFQGRVPSLHRHITHKTQYCLIKNEETLNIIYP